MVGPLTGQPGQVHEIIRKSGVVGEILRNWHQLVTKFREIIIANGLFFFIILLLIHDIHCHRSFYEMVIKKIIFHSLSDG